MTRISQREARRLKKRVAELESAQSARTRRWGSDYPGGVNIDFIDVKDVEATAVRTAITLGHAVVLRMSEQHTNRVLVYAVKP